MDKKQLPKKPELTIWGTPKSPRILHFANKVTVEFDKNIRKHSTKAKCMITEMLEKYQAAYIEKLEREKLEKQQKETKKEN